jgi:hypothetical protein
MTEEERTLNSEVLQTLIKERDALRRMVRAMQSNEQSSLPASMLKRLQDKDIELRVVKNDLRTAHDQLSMQDDRQRCLSRELLSATSDDAIAELKEAQRLNVLLKGRVKAKQHELSKARSNVTALQTTLLEVRRVRDALLKRTEQLEEQLEVSSASAPDPSTVSQTPSQSVADPARAAGPQTLQTDTKKTTRHTEAA